jgi:hypothetical protein
MSVDDREEELLGMLTEVKLDAFIEAAVQRERARAARIVLNLEDATARGVVTPTKGKR